MEYILIALLAAAGWIAAFIFGVNEGRKLREVRTKIIENGVVTEETEIAPTVKTVNEDPEIVKSIENLTKYEAQYPGVKE
jgi:hypothetical protein